MTTFLYILALPVEIFQAECSSDEVAYEWSYIIVALTNSDVIVLICL